MSGVDWSLLADSLLRIERAELEESGLLSFGLENVGGIFVEKKRVCWAAARGRARRLRDLLGQHASADREILDAAFERCRERGKPVGQSLVEEGLVSCQELEKALRQHSAECLLELCRSSLPMRWSERPGRGYAPKFTFRPAELWLDAVGVAFPEQRELALSELQRLASTHRELVAFVVEPETSALLPVATFGEPSVAELRVLAQFAAAMPRASLELAAAPTFTLACTDDGQSALIWWRSGVLFAALCRDRESLAAATVPHLVCA